MTSYVRSMKRRAYATTSYKAPLGYGRAIYRAKLYRNLKFSQPELKFYDGYVNAAQNGTGAQQLGAVFTPVLGTGANNRLGDKVIVKSIQVQLEGYYNTTTTHDQGFWRVALVIDKVANNQTNPATWTTVFNGNGLNALKNNAYGDRFKVLWDEMVPVFNLGVAATNPTAAENVRWCRRFYKKLNLPVQFSASTPAWADVVKNGIFLTFWWDGTTTEPYMIVSTKVRFIDS